MRGRMVAPVPMVSAVLTPVAQSVVMQRAAWLDDGSVHGGEADGRPRRIKFRSAGDRTDRADLYGSGPAVGRCPSSANSAICLGLAGVRTGSLVTHS